MLVFLSTLALSTSSYQIGNYLTNAPNGVAFIIKDRAAFVIDPGGEYYAGTAAPDDSYHESKFKVDNVEVTFEWGRVGDDIVARISAPKETKVKFDLSQNWPGWKNEYTPNAAGVQSKAGEVTWRFVSNPAPAEATATAVTLKVAPSQSAKFIAGFGKKLPFGSIDSTLDKAKKRYLENRPRAEGDYGDFLSAIADNLNNSRVYSTDNKLTAVTVSRGWAADPNNAPYFCWDSFFNGNLAMLDDPEIAKATIRAILSVQTEEGLVPNFGHWIQSNGSTVSADRSQPPMGSLCVWRMHQRQADVAFLKEVYPKLLKWHRWWPIARDAKQDGLLEWGSTLKGMQEAQWETGWDDTVHFAEAKMEGRTMNAYAVDLCSMWALDAQYLANIAEAIGEKEEAKTLRAEHDRTAKLINEKLWNPELGLYCSRLWDGKFLTRITPMNFYPLLAGIAPADRAQKTIEMMTTPKRFWGERILPTVAYDDPVWPQQHYWKGKVWAPVNYIVFQGLIETASPEVLNEYAERGLKLFMSHWEKDRACGENFQSSDGAITSDSHYTWGALLCLIALENTVCVLPDGKLRLNGTLQRSYTLHNVLLKGKRYEVVVKPNRTELHHNGKSVAVANAQVLNVKG